MVNPQQPDFENTPANTARVVPGYQPADPKAAPRVTIVTPFYNTGSEFEETARSVFLQTFQQWEWIIVNDGSTDADALRRLAPYRGGDERVRVLDHPSNRGLSAARNTGFAAAQTSSVVILDSDDLLEPSAVEKWFWYLETHPEAAFVSSRLVCFGAKTYLWSGGFNDGEANLERNRITSIGMVRRDVHQAVGGYDEAIRGGLEDWEFWVRCAAAGYWGDMLEEYLAWIRTRASHADRWENLQEERISAFREDFRRRFPHLYNGGFPRLSSVKDLELADAVAEPVLGNNLKKARPRLLMVVPWLVVGGAERFDLNLMQQLISHEWDVTVVATTPSDHPWRYEFEKLTADVFCLDGFIPWKNYARFFEYMIESRQFDALVLAGSREGYRLLPFLRSRFPKLAILDYLHFPTPNWMNGGIPRLSVVFQDFIDRSAVASGQMRQWLVDEKVDAARIDVCPINIDTRHWKPDPQIRIRMRHEARVSETETVILYVARIEQQKQPMVFAQTLLKLKEKGIPFTAVVIGDGSMLPALREFVQDRQLAKEIRLLGSLPGDRVKDWMCAGDILFLPSENEGIASVFYEGMACGLVVVGADVGGQSELVTPETGVLIARGEDEAHAYSLVLEELIQNPARRSTMASKARERVETTFDVNNMGERMLEIIERARNQPRSIAESELPDVLRAHLLRQTIEYWNAYDVVQDTLQRFGSVYLKYKELVDHPPMPVASPTTYFYFGFRAILYPLYRRVLGKDSSWVSRVIQTVKKRMVAIKVVIHD